MVEKLKKQHSPKKSKKSARQGKAVELTGEELAARAALEEARVLAAFQEKEAAPPQEEEAVLSQEEEVVPPEGEEDMEMDQVGGAGAPRGVVVAEPLVPTFKEVSAKGQASGSKIPKAKKGKEKEWEDPPTSDEDEEEEEVDYSDGEDHKDHEEEEEAVSEERRNPRRRKEAPKPRSGSRRTKAPIPSKECVYKVTSSLLEDLVTRRVKEVMAQQGMLRDYDRGVLPMVPTLRKWSDTDAKRPIRKFLEEVEVWFDAMDIKGARRVTTFSTLLEDTPCEWLLAEKAKYPEGLDNTKTWKEMKEMMVTRFVPKHQHLLDGIALVKVHQESRKDSLKRYAREFQAKMVPCSKMNEYPKLVNFYVGLEEVTR
jgi:hypothetical protein